MVASVVAAILTLLPTLVLSSGDGNIRLLENEVAAALKACSEVDNSSRTQKHKRSTDGSPRIDESNKQGSNQYSHERRNMTDGRDQTFIINATDYDYDGFESGNEEEKLMQTLPRMAEGASYPNVDANGNSLNRTRRSDPLIIKSNNDLCLSQCVFANLQVVDSRGIPREAELWTKVQSSVTSEQSRTALKDQIGACFQELQSEAEDDGCSYSNKLERCLMLRFSDRKPQSQTEKSPKT